MNAKHTSGPWHVTKRLRIDDSNGKWVASACKAGWTTDEQAAEHAALIAAAPELLEALREAIGCIEILADACSDRVREVDVAKFYAAIAKATGA